MNHSSMKAIVQNSQRVASMPSVPMSVRLLNLCIMLHGRKPYTMPQRNSDSAAEGADRRGPASLVDYDGRRRAVRSTGATQRGGF